MGVVAALLRRLQTLTNAWVNTCAMIAQVKELILPYGELRAFNLVMDKNTGNSKVRSAHRLLQDSQYSIRNTYIQLSLVQYSVCNIVLGVIN